MHSKTKTIKQKNRKKTKQKTILKSNEKRN